MELNRSKFSIAILLAFLIGNPFIFFLLSKNLLVTITFLVLLFIFIMYLGLLPSKMNWIRVYLMNFLILFSLICHFEVIFRFAFSDHVIENLYKIKNGYYTNKPNLDKTFDDKEYSVKYITNSQGYRISNANDPKKEIEHVDWLFIGDSYTQGAQVEFEELFTSLFYKYYPNKIIQNVGISGFGIVEEYNYYKYEGYKLGADKVFLQLCNFNDFMNVSKKRNQFSDYLIEYSYLFRSLLYDFKYKRPGELPLGRWTEPFYPDLQDNIDYNIFFKKSSEKKENDIQEFKKYLAMFNDIVKKNGSELIVILIPTKEQSYYSFFEEVIVNYNIDINDLNMNLPNEIVKQMSDSLGFKLLDCLDPFQTDPNLTFYDYDEHLNKYGHSQLAIYLQNFLSEGSKQKKIKFLSNSFLGDRYPSPSIDGNVIFQSFRDGNMELFFTDSTFLTPNRITFNRVDESHPAISPNGEKIIFTEGNQELGNTNIIELNRDSRIRKNITSDLNTYGAIPSYSIDGNSIVYAEWKWDSTKNRMTQPYIVYFDLASNNKQIITNISFESWRPVISPNNEEVIYISKRNGQFDLFLYNRNTLNEKQLTTTPYDEWDPSFSSDGKQIVYSANSNDNWDLWVMKLSNLKTKRITETKGDEWDAFFTDNNNSLLFGGVFGSMQGIYKMELDSTTVNSY